MLNFFGSEDKSAGLDKMGIPSMTMAVILRRATYFID
jgi:hypothetical protein